MHTHICMYIFVHSHFFFSIDNRKSNEVPKPRTQTLKTGRGTGLTIGTFRDIKVEASRYSPFPEGEHNRTSKHVECLEIHYLSKSVLCSSLINGLRNKIHEVYIPP